MSPGQGEAMSYAQMYVAAYSTSLPDRNRRAPESELSPSGTAYAHRPGGAALALVAGVPSWTDGAPCGDTPDLWFSESKGDKTRAKTICAACPFAAECREYGKGQEFGIWGGMDMDLIPAGEIERANGRSMAETLVRARRAASLSERRATVLKLATEGLSKAAIARRLGIAQSSVTNDLKVAA